MTKKDGKSAQDGSKTARVGSPGDPKIVQKSMKNRLWDRPGAVGPLFDLPGWSGRGVPPPKSSKMTKIPSKSMPCRPYPKGQTWTKNARVLPCFDDVCWIASAGRVAIACAHVTAAEKKSRAFRLVFLPTSVRFSRRTV